jgi:MFS transporter, SP family, general alpha glucoside:H+ symporter
MSRRRASHIEEVVADPNTDVLHTNDNVLRKASVAVDNFAALSAEARDATDKEHRMGFLKAIKLYPKAAGWSILLSTSIVMEGYDTLLLGNLYAFPAFTSNFGIYDPTSDPPSYQVSSAVKGNCKPC